MFVCQLGRQPAIPWTTPTAAAAPAVAAPAAAAPASAAASPASAPAQPAPALPPPEHCRAAAASSPTVSNPPLGSSIAPQLLFEGGGCAGSPIASPALMIAALSLPSSSCAVSSCLIWLSQPEYYLSDLPPDQQGVDQHGSSPVRLAEDAGLPLRGDG